MNKLGIDVISEAECSHDFDNTTQQIIFKLLQLFRYSEYKSMPEKYISVNQPLFLNINL